MSVLVDTNVVSELIRQSPEPAVAGWAAARDLRELFFSAVGEAELRYGAAILAAGRRRESLVADIEGFLSEAFDNRILPFDSAAARAYADIAAMRRSAGRPTQPADCQIGAFDGKTGRRSRSRWAAVSTTRAGVAGCETEPVRSWVGTAVLSRDHGGSAIGREDCP